MNVGRMIRGVHIETGEVIYFENVKEAEKYGHRQQNISKSVRGICAHHHGYVWSYLPREKDGRVTSGDPRPYKYPPKAKGLTIESYCTRCQQFMSDVVIDGIVREFGVSKDEAADKYYKWRIWWVRTPERI